MQSHFQTVFIEENKNHLFERWRRWKSAFHAKIQNLTWKFTGVQSFLLLRGAGFRLLLLLCAQVLGKKKKVVSESQTCYTLNLCMLKVKNLQFFLANEWQWYLFHLVAIFEALNTVKCPFVRRALLCWSTLSPSDIFCHNFSRVFMLLCKHMSKADSFCSQAISTNDAPSHSSIPFFWRGALYAKILDWLLNANQPVGRS